VPPSTFIPIAEEIGLIEPLGTWVLGQACAAFVDWQRRFPDRGLEYVTVNVSGRQLMQENLLMVVEEAVRSSGMRPCDLCLEITETALVDRPGDAARVLGALREFGVRCISTTLALASSRPPAQAASGRAESTARS
jgi:EAL domain-containing protein (putative c-di-GMP-specific phosphodiesterase class I)